MQFAIWSLAAAAFAMITTEFNIIGVLPLIAHDFSVPIPQVGLLVTAFAFTVAATGPFLTVAYARVNRRTLFTGILVVSAAGNAIAAVAPNYPLLAIGRIVSALALPVFWSMASSTAAGIAGPERAGRAIATVFAGISVASVCGVPATTLMASVWGWRAAFAAAGVVCVAMALTVWLVFPRSGLEVPSASRSPLVLLRQRAFLAHLLLSLLVLTAMFTAYTYLADSMERIGNYEPSTVGWALIGFGGAGIVGNAFAGRALDGNPMGASITAAAIVGAAMAASASTIASPFGAAIVLVLWGAAHAASFVANHVRVIKAAPAGYEDIAASLNVSVFNAGIGMGAVVGGRLIDAIGLSHIGLGAGAIIVVALGHGTLLQRATGVNAEVAGSS